MAVPIPARASQVTTIVERLGPAAELQHHALFRSEEEVRGDAAGNRLSRSESLLSSRVRCIIAAVVLLVIIAKLCLSSTKRLVSTHERLLFCSIS